MGILSQLSFVVTLAFCAPLITLGAQYAFAGKSLALLFFGLAALVLGVERYVLTPDDVAIAAAERVVGTVARDPDEE
ncbi:DUF7533 family protein [Halarchaeum salinum]|uniref:Uncharacterized protein n=1 Tax=Halarchaeum salinum TaxID=489912 RepID=A0AAV3S9X5_9EURY